MNDLIAQLIDILSRIEAYIDFPDEDLPEQDHQVLLDKLDVLLTGTNQLLATSHYGDLLREGIKTIIVGEPNVGKSSLLNRLVGRERALVSPEPGTTRDYIEDRLIVGSHWLRLIDTAGLNNSPSALEQLGIRKTFEQSREADLFLWVIDSTRPVPVLPAQLQAQMTPANTVAVFNKIDLPPFTTNPPHTSFAVVKISALQGDGFDALQIAVQKLAESFQVETGDELIAINARHANSLEQAKECLEEAAKRILDKGPIELSASDLRSALDFLGQISGKIDNEKILDKIFAEFCIGK